MFLFILVVNLNNDYSCYHPPGRHPTCPWSFRAPPPTTSHIFLMGADQRTFGPSGRRPMRPFGPLGRSSICVALGPSRSRPTPRDTVTVRPRRRLSQKNATVATGKGSSCEIWIEKKKKKKRKLTMSTLQNRFLSPPPSSVDCCVSCSYHATTK